MMEEIIKNPIKELENVGKNLYFWGDADIKNCNAIHVYDGTKYAKKNICSRRQFDEEKIFLRDAFSRGIFNLFAYLNQSSGISSYFLTYVPDMNRLEDIFERINKDINGGHLPFKCVISNVFNINKARRCGGSLL